jgi:GT2 family glycosyltransferase
LVNHAEPVSTVAYPQAACLLLTRDLYWKAGGFDERYQPNCYEDAAFGFALADLGADVVMVPDATITHYVHGNDPSGLALRSVTEHLDEYHERIYKNRWLFDLLVLKGWRRWLTMGLGLPRTALESWRIRSVAPARGYCIGWKVYLQDRMVSGRARA